MKEHKNHTKTFDELDYNEQAKSITAMINNLSNAIRAHVRGASTASKNPNKTLLKCIGQCARMIDKLTK